MKLRIKYGFTAAHALELLREAECVRIFVGYDEDRFLLKLSKGAAYRDLKAVPSDHVRLCEFDVERRELIFGSFRAKHHADLLKEAGLPRAFPVKRLLPALDTRRRSARG